MAALGEAASVLSEGKDGVAQGPAAPPEAALPLQPFQSRPAPAGEAQQIQRLVAVAGKGQPDEASLARKAVSDLVLSAGLPAPASSSPGNLGPSPPPAQESGLLTPPLSSSAQSFNAATEPLPASSALHNAAQQLQDVARRVALQQGKSEAAAAALPPARLLPAQQFETICVQVQSDQTKENERPELSFAAVQSQDVAVAQPVEKNAKVLGLNVINPQIIRILPLTETGSDQFFLHNSSGPTIQLLLQRPLHPRGQVSADKITTHCMLNEQRSKTTHTPNITVISTNLANSAGNLEKKQKLKKNLKVKTRSGRISRPPKYKAKDYKFIKTEDLADCHQSDSDDYSELSVEDDEEGKEKETPSLFGALNCDLRPKLFKCQTCEKSYIGKGGLARHYKLNPDHGPQECSPSSSLNSLCMMTLLEDAGKANGQKSYQTVVPPQVTDTLTNKKGDATENQQQSGTGEGKRIFAVQQKDTRLLHSGLGRPRPPRQRGRPRNAERSRYSSRFSKPGQFPSKFNNKSAEYHSVFRRKARLEELIQQCTNEDFMELVVPHFTAFVTVFEFLLMKVKKDEPAKTLFPGIYREFEELHAMVMKMCQEYFSNPEIKEPVEIKNPKVAESLGINCNLFGVQSIQAGSSSKQVKTFGKQIFPEASGQKRAAESSNELLPLAKRSREESLLENMNDYANHHGMEETSATNEDFPPEDNCGNRLVEEQCESLELEVGMDCANPNLSCQPMKAVLENLQLSRKLGLDCCPSCLFEPSVNAENLPEKLMKANSPWNTASRPKESGFCSTLAFEESSENPGLSEREENSHKEKYQELQQKERKDSSITKKAE
ncbi:zinc finger protein 839 [Eublepharis macularius]|uniref:Zinc finger protein 839 n=1 Tax=Eublepharis macularius TaxID=481883 RepID=A0AA97KSH6_EUBMA|nr:zinc finger protein 839 [Eublepharis macularius]